VAPVAELHADRYELGDRIGAGGMGEVYRGRDLLLERAVAIKIPTAEITPSSAERFKREARAAARLNHPNVVGVYDWGGGATPFIVMEFVDGQSLRAVLHERDRLGPDEVARIGAQIADALAHAHAHGVVHRDVKPSNVLLTPAGDVKVTDFGIALSATGEALTEPGVVLGTAGYLSPEQVAGLPVDARSDVYSLGIVLTELLTGSRPTGGEPAPATELEHIVARARAADPNARYPRAAELRDALRAVATSGDTPITAAVVVVPTTSSRATAAAVAPATTTAKVGAPTSVMPAAPAPPSPPVPVVASSGGTPAPAAPPRVLPVAGAALPVAAAAAPSPAPAVPAVKRRWFRSRRAAPATPVATPKPVKTPTSVKRSKPVKVAKPVKPLKPPKPKRGRRPRGATTTPAASPAAASPAFPPAFAPAPSPAALSSPKRTWRARHFAVILAAPLVLVVGGVVAYAKLSEHAPSVAVPDVVDRDVFTAAATMKQAGFEIEVTAVDSAQPGGIVVTQKPTNGQKLEQGSTVHFSVSSTSAVVPDVVHLDETAAMAALAAKGLSNVTVTDDYRGDIDPGTVVSASPAPFSKALKNQPLTLVVARDPHVTLPNLVGSDQAAAIQSLHDIGLEVAIQTSTSRSAPAGQVLKASPAVDAVVLRGSTVTLTVSTGPKLVTLPSKVTFDRDDAISDLEDRGFSVIVTSAPSSSDQNGTVIAQNPPGGKVAEGSTVTITVGVQQSKGR
jgi:eukaryotic-like serine/threonine-protein kinase